MSGKIDKKKNLVVGLGEIGYPLFKLISKVWACDGCDNNSKIMSKKFEKYDSLSISLMHICIPYSNKFEKNIVKLVNKFQPEVVVIHSTIKPFTTNKIQQKISIPVIYSATRGVHKRMLYDLKRYTKFFAIESSAPQKKKAYEAFEKVMKKCGVKTKRMSDPITLELAKIVTDTSYYGWLINYAQISNILAKKHGVDYDEMWSFSDEIHKFLRNRPKMIPGFIGGHCVIPNLDLLNDKNLRGVNTINSKYKKFLGYKLE